LSPDIDGIATAGKTPVTVAYYLGLTSKWIDGTAVGSPGRPARAAARGSFMIHVRHDATAIAAGLCDTVLITRGKSGRSGVAHTRNVVSPTRLAGSPLPSLPRKRVASRGKVRAGWADGATDFGSRSRFCAA
jgi:hypothetical protein